MCTVTYIPKKNNTFILTSNRDEAVGRITLAPDFYDVDGTKMLFPKDAVAGGTWIGVSEKSRMICLLNGGFEIHVRKESYRMSRGIIVKELLKAADLSEAIDTFNYEGIEPFTIVAIDWSGDLKATELVWDGGKAHITVLDNEPKIWSSSTLYDATMKEKRRTWFAAFKETTDWSRESLFDFHTKAGEGDAHVDLQINRGLLKTVSVTQVEKIDDTCVMTYNDLQKDEVYTKQFEMIPA
ncbi:hypothetical protein DCS32_08340 [Dokdonia sp. Dokd-P16]|uniref:NRDE family protein n=1 Tax=Dokdonia sp. Dokd-P16 TaxID=2173169 RepID=UPI000D547149|nr:NRDE family protein [Dokdonia sp. Dokd-P16]AWH74168.1 hypothetical protein DCS32_08340 [Dokdonia sp. Dokd-P16]